MVELSTRNSGELQDPALDAVFTCMASRERRRILGVASEHAPESVSRDELATVFAATRSGTPRSNVTDEQVERSEVALHHEHLPMLTEAGLLELDEDDEEAVTLADHSAFQDSGIIEVIESDASPDSESLDALFDAISEGRRRALLDVLSHQFGPIHLETLARELLTRDSDVTESDVPPEDVERVATRLHHVDLPQLAAAGVASYEPDDQMVAYEGHPLLRVPWMHSVLQPAFRRSITGESSPDGIGEIEGREQVISFGQSLCESADEELFCMFTDTQLLEAGCLTRIRDAARERDVDVYLGTPNPTIREYVAENAPEVVLWEPNTDWLNVPVAGDRVGRLVLADREAVMLGTLLEQTTDDLQEERAIIGEGERNTLVTMISQLLGPHLEGIDQASDDVEVSLRV